MFGKKKATKRSLEWKGYEWCLDISGLTITTTINHEDEERGMSLVKDMAIGELSFQECLKSIRLSFALEVDTDLELDDNFSLSLWPETMNCGGRNEDDKPYNCQFYDINVPWFVDLSTPDGVHISCERFSLSILYGDVQIGTKMFVIDEDGSIDEVSEDDKSVLLRIELKNLC